MAALPITILVNSCDSYEDCWIPFFKLFSAQWPQCPYPIILNTERKDFVYPDLNLKTSRVTADYTYEELPWSDRLLRCLEQVSTEYVLYMHEDFFLNAPVNQKLIDEFAAVMVHHGIAHIRLMEFARPSEYRPSGIHPLLWEVPERADYRINLQAALWRKEVLCTYLVPGESPWEFERWGTSRSYQRNDRLLCQSLDYFNAKGQFVVPYHPGSVIRGKWNEPAVKHLFAKHGITVDFSKRGLHRPGVIKRWLIPWRARARRGFMKGIWLLVKISEKFKMISQ